MSSPDVEAGAVGAAERGPRQQRPQATSAMTTVPATHTYHRARVYLYVITACMSSAVMSVTAAWSSPALAKIGVNGDRKQLSRWEEVVVQGTLPCAAALGVVLGWSAASLWGRKPALLFGGLLSLSGWLFLGMAPRLQNLIVGRSLNGLSVGILNIASAFYIPEIAPKELQGVLFSLAQVFTNLGCLMEFGVGPFVSLDVLAGVSSVWAVVFTALSLLLPESPYFLVSRKKTAKAEQVLIKLRGTKDVGEEFKLIQDRASTSLSGWGRIKLMMSERRHIRGALVVGGACLLRQLTGGVAISSYVQPLFIFSGLSLPSGQASLVLGAVKTVASIGTTFIAKKISVKTLLIVSCLGVAIFLMTLSGYLYLNEKGHLSITYLNWLPLFSMIMYFAFMDIGIGPFPSFIGSTTLEWEVRSAGVALSICLGYVVNAFTMIMVVSWYLPLALACFAASALIAIPLLYIFMKDINKEQAELEGDIVTRL